jgi:hypothetical protein
MRSPFDSFCPSTSFAVIGLRKRKGDESFGTSGIRAGRSKRDRMEIQVDQMTADGIVEALSVPTAACLSLDHPNLRLQFFAPRVG